MQTALEYMIKYKLILGLGLLILAGTALAFRWSATQDSERPNILFLIADDWSYPHAGAYGDPLVRTPTFDRLAREGVLFEHAYCAAPSCTPSRGAILTGRFPHQLASAGNLWSVFRWEYPTYVSELARAGYFTGSSRKGWAPGEFRDAEHADNPAGRSFTDFKTFLRERPAGQPFCFWFGSSDPHREYEANTGVEVGMDRDRVVVPPIWPDVACVRNDLLDYYYEVERFDRECGNLIATLEAMGELDNTLIVMTSDNGMPFPRAKANLYDLGTRMPMVLYWQGKILPGRRITDFVSHTDLAPTLLSAAGVSVPAAMTGGSNLLPLLQRKKRDKQRQHIFLERERHANVRRGNLSYPMRAVRTHDYLYIRNFEPGRWPAGDSSTHQSVGQYGDVDNSITKFLVMAARGSGEHHLFELTFGKRPAEELYLVAADPYQIHNLADLPQYRASRDSLARLLTGWMQSTQDLRFTEPQTAYWDTVRYTPSYQHRDYDLREKIANYPLADPLTLKVEAGCQ